MATFRERFGRLGQLFSREPVKPTKEQGVPGFALYGGYLQPESNKAKLFRDLRWRTALDILQDISIVAASVRFMANLVSRPAWTWEPADDSDAAQEAADFMQNVIDGLNVSWTRVVRRSLLYKYHGFMVQEWVALKRDDGKIGLESLEPRPQRTIAKWDVDDAGMVIGLAQTDPQTGKELYLPRRKLFYLVDDTLTDRPDGMGWFHHLVDPSDRLKSLLDLESIGYERDLRGVPIGRAPIQELNKLVADGKLTEAQRDKMLSDLEAFVALQRKTSETGLLFDSKPYDSKTETGTTPSSVLHWDLSIVTGDPGSIEEIGDSIRRLQFEIALIIGTEVIMTGREGQGSKALSEDKSKNLYLNANSILADIAEAADRDIRDPVWAMNGLPDELKPKAKPENVDFKDVQEITQALVDMATAGAILAPDDPAFDDVRMLLGISPAEPLDLAMIRAMRGEPDPDASQEDQSAADSAAASEK